MIARGILFYVGWALIPTPPSPVPDFGVQFLLALLIGLLAPQRMVRPVNKLVTALGRFCKWLFGKIPIIRIIVEKAEIAFIKWKEFVEKERDFDNIVYKKLHGVFVRKDIIERLIFGYVMTSLIGSIMIITSVIYL